MRPRRPEPPLHLHPVHNHPEIVPVALRLTRRHQRRRIQTPVRQLVRIIVERRVRPPPPHRHPPLVRITPRLGARRLDREPRVRVVVPTVRHHIRLPARRNTPNVLVLRLVPPAHIPVHPQRRHVQLPQRPPLPARLRLQTLAHRVHVSVAARIPHHNLVEICHTPIHIGTPQNDIC